MKFLLDQGLPRSSAAILADEGIECWHTSSKELSQSSDREILEFAKRENSVVVTLDADFHSLLAVSGASGPSVIRLRVEGLRAVALAALLKQIISTHEDALVRGAALTVGPKRTAVHYLPIIRPGRR